MKLSIVALIVGLAVLAGCESSKQKADNAGENAKVVMDDVTNTAKEMPDSVAKYEQPGFSVHMEDGRLWVFRDGSDALAEFKRVGEPAKSVTLVGAGPDGRTLRGADRDVLEAYRKACGL